MQLAFVVTLLLAALPLGHGAAILGKDTAAAEKDRPITEVVKLLQNMLDESKADGNTERVLYAKYKCYCDTNEATKKAEIETLTKQISLLESEIEELQAKNSILSTEVANLKADMEANQAAQGKATTVRGKENTAWLALEKDLDGAIVQVKDAIKTLAEVGADQTLGQSAADHEKMMAGYEGRYGYDSPTFLRLRSTVKQALLLASPAKVAHKKVLEAFLQAPFTGVYTSQSAEVIGILKDMEDTFKYNLEAARAAEAKALEAYDAFMKAMGEEYDAMKKSKEEKQGELVSNDNSLGVARKKLTTAVQEKADAEEFLEKLIDMCAVKAKEYDTRTLLRANEEAAIAEAVSILNSDAAFATFGKVDATSVPTLLQVHASKKHNAHGPMSHEAQKQRAEGMLRGQPNLKHSGRVAKILALLAANNPFTVVLKEIQKMIDLIADEGKVDEEQLEWCRDERKVNNKNLDDKKAQIVTLNGQIAALEELIDHPVTGLKKMIADTEESLETNTKSQTDETAERTKDNLAYQEDISHLVEAESLVSKAIEVLDAYYAKILAGSLIQTSKEDPAPPATWDAKYSGRSASGTSAIDMLKFILGSTQKEEEEAHDAERVSQHAYEDSMQTLKDEEERLLKDLAKYKLDLAEAEKKLLERREDLKVTIEEKEAIEAYLLKIKPGCDFIEDNIALRKTNRADETGALESAKDFLEGSPAYLTAVAEAHNESLAECLEICTGAEDHVDCKACLAHVSVPGYCAGHPGTTGC